MSSSKFTFLDSVESQEFVKHFNKKGMLFYCISFYIIVIFYHLKQQKMLKELSKMLCHSIFDNTKRNFTISNHSIKVNRCQCVCIHVCSLTPHKRQTLMS